MPAKKEVILQHVLACDEDYHRLINKDGLTIVDVYAKWCGPCKAIVPLFRRLRNEIGDDLLRFAVAEADSIEALAEYRNRSQPTFLFLATGAVLVKVIRDPNGPIIEKAIVAELKQEHMALEGQVDRVEFQDTFFEELAAKRAAEEAAAEAERNKIVPIRKQLALVVIKPDIEGEQVQEVINKIVAGEFEVLKKKQLVLDREQAEDLYASLKEEGDYEEHIEHAISGSCCVLVISKKDRGESVIADLREVIGPNDLEDARDNYPETIRAEYATDNIKNAVHLSTSKISAEREILTLFPLFKSPWVPGTAPAMQLGVMVVPPGHAESAELMVETLADYNCRICGQREVQLDQDDIDMLFAAHKESEAFEAIGSQMLSGPSKAVLVEHEEIIETFSHIVGPALSTGEEENGEPPIGCFRSKYAVEDVLAACLHASVSLEQAEVEVKRLFPMQQTLAIIKPGAAMEQKEAVIEDIKTRGFIIAVSDERTLTVDVVEQFYEEHKEKEFFAELIQFMSVDPVEVMVLSARNGVQAWRDAIGPTDPAEAKEHDPTCLRAQYGGEEIMQNAVHGSATVEDALREITLMFGEEIEFGDDGNLKREEEEGTAGEEGEANEDGEKPAEGEKQEGEKPADGEAPTDGGAVAVETGETAAEPDIAAAAEAEQAEGPAPASEKQEDTAAGEDEQADAATTPANQEDVDSAAGENAPTDNADSASKVGEGTEAADAGGETEGSAEDKPEAQPEGGVDPAAEKNENEATEAPALDAAAHEEKGDKEAAEKAAAE